MTDGEVLAFDLYGTLVDPIAVSSELDLVLGGSDGAEVARLWRLKQLEYSFRLTAMGHCEDFRWGSAPTRTGSLSRRPPYLHPAERLAVPISRIRLVTCNAFDSVGASAAGMRTARVNRSAAPFDPIGAQPDLTLPDLTLPALDRLSAALRQ